MKSASRLLRAAVISGACALFFSTHVFVDYVWIRAKIVRAPVAATGGHVRATATPEVLKGLPAPFAVIARIRNDATAAGRFIIQIDGRTVCEPSVAARSTHRIDCAFERDWTSSVPHEVTLRSSAGQWALEYMEFATHHGSSSGLLTLVVVPATSHAYKGPPAGWVVFLWMLLTGVLLLPSFALPRLVRWLHGAIVGFFALWVAVCLLSPWLSPYSVVVNAGSLVKWFLVLLAPRLYWLIRVPLPVWVRSQPLVLDVPAAAILLLGVFVECSGPTPQVHLFGVPLSIPSAAALAFLAAVVLAIRHWAVPEHPALARIFRGFGDPEATGEARLFGPPGEPAWRKAIEIGVVGVGFSALVAIVTWPQVARLDSVPDLGDPLFSMWRIAWIAHQIVRDPVHLFDGNMFYPEHLTLALSDPVIVPGLMSAPFFWLGGHTVKIYNLLFLSGFAFSGVTTYLLVRALTGRRDAAVVAGIVFALYPYRFEHYSHLELQMTMWAPLALLGLHRTLASGERRDGIATGFAVALQTLSSLYYGLFLLVFMGALGTVLWFARGRPAAPLRALLPAALVLGISVAPVAVQFTRNLATFSERPTGEVEYYSATAVDYLKPHFRSRLYGSWSANGFPERQLFPGVVVLALAVVALWPPVRAVRLGYAVAMAVAIDGSLGMHGVIFPWLRDYGGPFRGLRVPARFSVLVGLALAVLAGFAAARILERWPRWRVAIVGALTALVIADPLPRLELEQVWHEPPPIYTGLPMAPPAVLAEFPVPRDWRTFAFDSRYLYFSTFHWQRLVNGSSGVVPPSYLGFIQNVQTFPDDKTIKYLRARGIEYIGVHGAFYSPEDWRRVQAGLGARADIDLVTTARWNGSESRLYRLRR